MTIEEAYDLIAQSYRHTHGTYYSNWRQMESWVISLYGPNSRELFKRIREAKELCDLVQKGTQPDVALRLIKSERRH